MENDNGGTEQAPAGAPVWARTLEKMKKDPFYLRIWRQTSLTAKLIAIALITLVLQIPSCMIRDLMNQRNRRQKQVVTEIGSKWGGRQLLSGPFFCWTEVRENLSGPNSKFKKVTETVLPDDLKIFVKLAPSVRKRGIFQTVLYNADVTLSGTVSLPAAAPKKLFCTVALPDLRGLTAFSAKLAGRDYSPRALDLGNLKNPDQTDFYGALRQTGFEFEPPQNKEKIPFEIKLAFRGTECFLADPVGRITKIKMESVWHSPCFLGALLPETREVNSGGFRAEWRFSELNTNYPREWSGQDFRPGRMAAGTSLLIPANTYQQALRSVNYSLLFIGIFLFFLLLSEVLTKQRVAVIQYLIAGCAPVLFYLLLLSIGELTSFAAGYLIAAAAILALVAFYCILIFRKILPVLGMILMLAAAYAVMYLMLLLEDMALLVGSIALFVMLAVVMALTGALNRRDPEMERRG